MIIDNNEYVCLLNTETRCESREYSGHTCILKKKSKFATCDYMRVTLSLPIVAAEENTESPVNDQPTEQSTPVAQKSNVDIPF